MLGITQEKQRKGEKNVSEDRDKELYKDYLRSGFDKSISFYEYKKLMEKQKEMEEILKQPVGTD